MLKQELASDLFLILPDVRKPFILSGDTTRTGLGATLLQKDDQDIKRHISYASIRLIDREAKMSTVERERCSLGPQSFSTPTVGACQLP